MYTGTAQYKTCLFPEKLLNQSYLGQNKQLHELKPCFIAPKIAKLLKKQQDFLAEADKSSCMKNEISAYIE